MLNTGNSFSREEALNRIIKNMDDTLLYIPLAYKFEQSGCSCCLSEDFYLVYKINLDIKCVIYRGYINHTNKCAGIRCTCGEPFIWKNIIPEETILEKDTLKHFTFIKEDSWMYDWEEYIIEQQKLQEENEKIYKYNEEDEEDEENTNLKNYSYYFTPTRHSC
jgi:hypothetical protein